MAMKRVVVSTKDTMKVGIGGGIETWRVIQYTLDNHGPFTFEIRKDQFTWDAVKADMDREEKGLTTMGS